MKFLLGLIAGAVAMFGWLAVKKKPTIPPEWDWEEWLLNHEYDSGDFLAVPKPTAYIKEEEYEELPIQNCPICGSERIGIYIIMCDLSYRVECKECHLRTSSFENKYDAIYEWNSLADTQEIKVRE